MRASKMHAFAIALLLVASGSDKPTVATVSHVRAAQSAARLLQDAAERSATVRDLIAKLAGTDVIVYVEATPSPQIALARTKLVTATAAARFLRIGINLAVPPPDVPALLAHELQHALEIAECVDVRDDAGVRRLYTRIGHQHGVDQYETDAARAIERQVKEELRIARR